MLIPPAAGLRFFAKPRLALNPDPLFLRWVVVAFQKLFSVGLMRFKYLREFFRLKRSMNNRSRKLRKLGHKGS
jgi:hypothetical protein